MAAVTADEFTVCEADVVVLICSLSSMDVEFISRAQRHLAAEWLPEMRAMRVGCQ